MTRAVQCPNASCGRTSHLGEDPLGRIFRCPRCLTKLPTSGGKWSRFWLDGRSGTVAEEIALPLTRSNVCRCLTDTLKSHVVTSADLPCARAANFRLGKR